MNRSAIYPIATLVGVMMFAIAGPVRAGITGTTGAVTIVANPPADVSSNQWESNTLIRIFAEQQNAAPAAGIAVDISSPGTSPTPQSMNLSPATIAAGTQVNVFMLHFDVNGTRPTENALEATGSVTFDQPILGLIALSDTLNSSNAALGLPTLTYSNGVDHGLELNPNGIGNGTTDLVTLSADLKTVTVDLRNASFADDLRIITAVPEPTSLLLLVLGLSSGAIRAPSFARQTR
jgi:hypothetical protein